MNKLQAWRKARVRALKLGKAPHYSFYIRFTPNFGFGLPWFGGRRIRFAWHFGLQKVKWVTDRWYVETQIFGTDKVQQPQRK